MKHLKLIHALTGLLGLVFLILNGQIVTAAMNQTLPDSLPVLLLLVATLVSFAFGSYLETFRCNKRHVQLLGTLTLVSAVVLSSMAAFGNVLATMPMIMLLIIMSVLLHVVINLNTFNPITPEEYYEDSDREMGTVKWFNVTKGFGFITRDLGDDVFVHYRAIRGEGHRTLSEGQRVEFIVVDKDKGLQAEDVIAAKQGR